MGTLSLSKHDRVTVSTDNTAVAMHMTHSYVHESCFNEFDKLDNCLTAHDNVIIAEMTVNRLALKNEYGDEEVGDHDGVVIFAFRTVVHNGKLIPLHRHLRLLAVHCVCDVLLDCCNDGA